MRERKKTTAVQIPSGHAIEEIRGRILVLLSGLQLRVLELERQGCRMGYLHFKPSKPNVMFMLEPTDGTGKRRYVHIGTDPEKQEEAKAAIERHRQREAILRAIRSARSRFMDLNYQLGGILSGLIGLENEVKKNARGYAVAVDSAGSPGESVTPSRRARGSHQAPAIAGPG